MTEADYIKKINEQQKEIDECYELIAQANDKIKQLNLEAALANSSFTRNKAGISAAKAEKLRNRVEELENSLKYFSMADLSGKEDELNSFLRSIMRLRTDLASLKVKKRIRESEIDAFEVEVDTVSEELFSRYTMLMQTMLNIKTIDGAEDISKELLIDYAKSFSGNVPVLIDILRSYKSKISTLEKEVERLKGTICGFSIDGVNVIELVEKSEADSKLISAYKSKIDSLEYQLSKLGVEHDGTDKKSDIEGTDSEPSKKAKKHRKKQCSSKCEDSKDTEDEVLFSSPDDMNYDALEEYI